ncbi:hypothetical protein [Nocardioides acrostichi]|uniref:Uncharacterized protein n=1 Tax=Nocardioides acrostichi TaxID=2784339 RepID=A0A930YCD7_9ACTN|nr:hypothetical protein [Nocardioides acrostichi]MBF4161379.1 hypothetical protein [Nocardioides acrostichi]
MKRSLITGAISVALVAGGVATGGGVAVASPASSGISTLAMATTSCAEAKGDVRQARTDLARAKRQLRRAKHATSHRAAKVRRAKHRVAVRRHRLGQARDQRDQACAASPTDPASVLAEITKAQDQLGALPTGQLDGLLPAELTTALDDAIAQLTAALDQLAAQAPTATPEELTSLLAALAALDVPALVSAVEGLLQSLTSIPGLGDAGDGLQVLIDLLQGSQLPDGGALPGDLGSYQAQFTQAIAQLQAAAGAADPTQLAAQLQAAVATLQGLAGGFGGDNAPLGDLLELLAQLQDLGLVTPGDPSALGDFGAVLSALMTVLDEPDAFFSDLGDLLASGGLSTLLSLIGQLPSLPGLPTLPRTA